MNIIYKSPFDHLCKIIGIESQCITIEELKQLIMRKEDVFQHSDQYIDFNIFFNGKKIVHDLYSDGFDDDVFIQISLPLNGGKGGFGSMLRALGAQIEKTTNREACRDLSGRRLRDVNEEKRIKEWIKKQAERKEEENKKKEKLKRIAEGTIVSNINYEDPEFENFRTEIPDIVEESINHGLKRQQEISKQQQQQTSTSTSESLKRKHDDDEDENSSNTNTSSSSKKQVPEEASSSSNFPIKTDKNEKTNLGPEKKMLKKHNLWLGVDVSDSGSDSDSNDEEEKKMIQKQSKK